MTARAENGYRVNLLDSADGGRGTIADPSGSVVLERACHDASEARTYASTVRQHIYWLSPEKFREYYRI